MKNLMLIKKKNSAIKQIKMKKDLKNKLSHKIIKMLNKIKMKNISLSLQKMKYWRT